MQKICIILVALDFVNANLAFAVKKGEDIIKQVAV